ncbi:hypothetical protein RI054_15g73280 [Pseudoscourfieldia marina]
MLNGEASQNGGCRIVPVHHMGGAPRSDSSRRACSHVRRGNSPISTVTKGSCKLGETVRNEKTDTLEKEVGATLGEARWKLGRASIPFGFSSPPTHNSHTGLPAWEDHCKPPSAEQVRQLLSRMEARGYEEVSGRHYDHASNKNRSSLDKQALCNHGPSAMIVVVFEEDFIEYFVAKNQAAIFSTIRSLEDRWHVVFAQKHVLSTRSTLEMDCFVPLASDTVLKGIPTLATTRARFA